MTSINPSPSTSSGRSLKLSTYPLVTGMVRIGRLIQVGASYQFSAETMSSLPSLLMSAMAAVSEAPPSTWIDLKGSSPETRAKPAEVPDWEWTAALMPAMANRNRIRFMADSMGYVVRRPYRPAAQHNLIRPDCAIRRAELVQDRRDSRAAP